MARKPKTDSAESPEGESCTLTKRAATELFPIVGVGASAGGLEALTQLLKALPSDTGMAFVIVQHLDPTHESMLAEILSRTTKMPVVEVKDEPLIEPNKVYVIPPGQIMTMTDGHLKLDPRRETRGQHRSVDTFLRSLAEEQSHRSIGVVLSGMGSDGTLGLAEIKAEGGITFAQDATAAHEGMPCSAVAAGCVDFILPPEKIAEELARIGAHPHVAPLEPASAESSINKILRLLHETTGVDFMHYKSTTLYRRVSRRMLLHKFESLSDYLGFVQANPAELQALYRDILISVTSFFRDPATFETLKTQVFPQLFRDRSQQDPVRVWVLGCSTGEEAYSLAIALTEFGQQLGRHIPSQVFATDLNDLGIERARVGVYSKGIAQDVSPDRLRRFFVETEGGYQVVKPIREMCVFARQNVLADPPFSRMDLISCRNLLIYMEPVLQRKVIPLFHFALKPSGYLWLGNSETIGHAPELFDVADSKHKIYNKRGGSLPQSFTVPVVSPSWYPTRMEGRSERPSNGPRGVDVQKEADRLALAKYSPSGVLVNADLDIVQFRGDTSAYLASAPGKPSLNLFKMAREGLLVGLRTALQQAADQNLPVRHEGLQVKSNGGTRSVNLEVFPIQGNSAKERFYLVLFEEPGSSKLSIVPALSGVELHKPQHTNGEESESLEASRQVEYLTQELAATREYMQSLIEQQEASYEELQSANEEIQSSNEELQSINEELQTTKEEIQSSNEELTTVNDELRSRNEELDQANNDLTNLLASTNLVVVMLGADLRIRRFTPQAEKVLNLIAADVGRPIADINLPLDISDLGDRLAQVLDTVAVQEKEVRDKHGRWYSLRMRPYRTADNKIDGAVVVLVDIDTQKRSQESARESAERLRALIEQAAVGVKQVDLDGRLLMVNSYLCRMLGYKREELLSHHASNFIHPDDRAAHDDHVQKLLAGEIDSFVLEQRYLRKDGTTVWTLVSSSVGHDARGEPQYRISMVQDIDERMRAAESLRDAARHKDEFLAMLAHELRNPLAPLQNNLDLLRLSEPGSAEVENCQQSMQRQMDKIKRLVDDLLDASRISRGKIALNKDIVDLAKLVPQAIDAARASIEGRRELSVTLPESPVHVEGDSVRLEQVVGNLLDNAIKYTNKDGHIDVRLEREHGEAVIRIRDSGIGIARELLSKVFDLFVQADSSYRRERGGLGIGLALVRQIVGLHGGVVQAKSEGTGKGSEFIVRLPLLDEVRATEELAGRAANRPQSGSAALRVLVVDDNEDAAKTLAMLLQRCGHEAQVANSGAAALELLKDYKPDAAMLDIGLPGMDGCELAQRIRMLPHLESVILIALTGYGQEEDRRRFHEAGFNAHFVKPISLETLQTLLATVPKTS